MYCTCCLNGAVRFEAGKIHCEGHWKGWALEIEPFLGPKKSSNDVACLKTMKYKRHTNRYVDIFIYTSVVALLWVLCVVVCRYVGILAAV